MSCRPLHRIVAAFLVAQPVFWMSSVAYAQSLREEQALMPGFGGGGSPAGAGGMPLTLPIGLGGTELMQSDASTPGMLPAGPPAIDEPIDPDKYLCGPGDILEFNFWGVQNFKLRLTVDLEGRVFVPKVGYFRLQGKTVTQARTLLREAAARNYPRLQSDVTLAEPRTFRVQVVDGVERPGAYLARAVDRVATVITRAGGFGANASQRRVEIRRRDGTVLTADVLLYFRTGDVKHNPYLLEGDVVHVPYEGLAATIGGAVNRPGRYELTGTKDLEELMALAAGPTPDATHALPVTVVRRTADGHSSLTTVDQPDGKFPALALQAEDDVRIPSTDELRQAVLVIGAVRGAKPSKTVVPTDQAGVAATAALHAEGTSTDEASDTRRLPWVKGDSVRTLVERVGGLASTADLDSGYILRKGQVIPVDLRALVMLRDFSADRPIELGDTLVIPFKRQSVVVEGAVFAAGPYPYHPAYTIEQYVELAGGMTRNAQGLDEVRVITPDGKTQAYAPGLKVEPGSTLAVPERSVSRSELVQIIVSTAAVLVSAAAVVVAASK